MSTVDKAKTYLIDADGYTQTTVKNVRVAELPPGIYTPIIEGSMFGGPQLLGFQTMKFEHDDLVDLGTESYKELLYHIKNFLTPRTKKRFKRLGHLYKMNFLLYGPPGTGKTCLLNLIAERVVTKHNGIVLFGAHPTFLPQLFEQLDKDQSNTLIMTVMEEFDTIAGTYEEELLQLLDGQIQRSNVIFAAATNKYEDVSPRLVRPGRFPLVLEIGVPDTAARMKFISNKLSKYKTLKKYNVKAWAESTDGMSTDEIMHSITEVVCLDLDLDRTIEKLRTRKAGNTSTGRGRVGFK